MTRIGRRIAEVRQARGLTQAAFAELLGYSVQYIGLLERGKQNVTLQKLAEIGNALGVSFDELVRKPRKRSMTVTMGRPRNKK